MASRIDVWRHPITDKRAKLKRPAYTYDECKDVMKIGSVYIKKVDYFKRLSDLVISLNKSGNVSPQSALETARLQLKDMLVGIFGNKDDTLEAIEELEDVEEK